MSPGVTNVNMLWVSVTSVPAKTSTPVVVGTTVVLYSS